MDRIIPFSPPDVGEDEIKEVIEAIKSGWITTGPKTKELEREVAKLTGSHKSVCLGSQSVCEEMVLRLLELKPGDEVITSAYTYTATAEAVTHINGVKLVLVDTYKDSFQMDLEQLESKINTNTKVIIPVDLAGIPCDYDNFFKIVNKKKDLFSPNSDLQKKIGHIVVVADAAHALGASYKGKMVGQIADFTTFSFHAVKNLTTAEGGAITWNNELGLDDEALYHKLMLLSLHGQSKDAFAKAQVNSWEYDIIGTWYKCNMTDIHAALGLGQIRRYDQMLAGRREIIEIYNKAFSNTKIKVLNHQTNDYVSSAHLYLARIEGIDEAQRNDIIQKMGEKGVAVNVHYKPLPMFTAYKNLGFDIKDYPNAFDYYHNEITLPLYSTLSVEDAKYIAESFVDTINEEANGDIE